MDLHDIHPLSLHELRTAAEEAGVDPAIKKRHEVAYALARLSSGEGEPIAAGFLELLNDGYGFLRQEEAGYAQSPDDVFVSAAIVRAGNLRAGDHIVGPVSPPKDGDKNLRLSGVDTVNGSPVNGRARKRRRFDALTPAYPDAQFRLEHSPKNLSTRFVDLFAPIGRGQRCLVVSPPKAGKTVLLKDIAHAITANHPAAELIVLLIDERPEEVTDMRESVRGHVVASTFDEPATRHVSVAEMTIERAKRLVEDGKDVIILLDSLTRLARAYNTTVPSTGKVLTGGVDSNALQRPKRFFGAARNLKEGGSLTIIATALVDTGSRMDDVIFEEFKGTGNSEIALDRKLMEKRVFPCLDINRSGTRKEELLQDEETLGRMWLLRGLLHPLSALDAMEFVKDRLAKTKTNAEFIATMNR